MLETVVEQGVIFIDTAGVCGDGRSEQFVGQFRKSHLDKKLFIATKMGRREPQIFDEYGRDNFIVWNDRSRINLQMDTLDLVQLHCPPTDVITAQRTYDFLDDMVE